MRKPGRKIIMFYNRVMRKVPASPQGPKTIVIRWSTPPCYSSRKETNKQLVPAPIVFTDLCGAKLVDRLSCQVSGHLMLAKQECCFWIPAERQKQVLVPAPIVFTDLCGAKLVDRLPCQILCHLTLAKQECCFWIPAERKKQVIGTSTHCFHRLVWC